MEAQINPHENMLYLFRFSIGERGTPEEGLHTVTVRAEGYNDCWRKLKRYFDDMYETKGRELKAIIHHTDGSNRTDFEFCGRTITIYEIRA